MKYIRFLVVLAFSGPVFAELPPVPTTLPTIPTDFPAVPTTLPTVVTGRSYMEIDCATAASKSDVNPRGIKLTKTLYSKGRKDLEFAWKVPNPSKSCLLFSVTFDGGQTSSAKFYVK